jgi:hypothetical protein
MHCSLLYWIGYTIYDPVHASEGTMDSQKSAEGLFYLVQNQWTMFVDNDRHCQRRGGGNNNRNKQKTSSPANSNGIIYTLKRKRK